MVVTFSSVHFSIAHSMRSNLKTASSSVMGVAASRLDLLAQGELHAIVGDRRHRGATDALAAGNSNSCPTRARRVRAKCAALAPVRAARSSGIFVGNPAAAGHVRSAVKSSRAMAMAMAAYTPPKIAVLAGRGPLRRRGGCSAGTRARDRAYQHRHDQPALLAHCGDAGRTAWRTATARGKISPPMRARLRRSGS